MNEKVLLEVRDLKTYFHTEEGVVKAVDGLSFSLVRGMVFALVGESGCGKSVTAFSIMKLIQCPPGKIEAEALMLDGKDLLSLNEKEMRKIRGSQIGMIFQEPMSSLNPVFTIGSQIVEAIELHTEKRGKAAQAHAIGLLKKVGIPEPAQRFHEYPHQLSGGMRQRVMIAIALSCNPKLLIADEPTTALDVSIQAQILDLLKELQRSEGLSILIITHDLGVVSETADVVGVMYASHLVEYSDIDTLFNKPFHPYTQGLFRSIPRLGVMKRRLETIQGNVPNPLDFPSGCNFHTRCGLTRELGEKAAPDEIAEIEIEQTMVRVLKQCIRERPLMREVAPGHFCACWRCPGYKNKEEG
jgi:oligopeptide/dipeptide ABC transporter ATP-binding protein